MKQLVLVGDSDIAFWPKDLLPRSGAKGFGAVNEEEWREPLVSGHPGATLAGVLPRLRRVLETCNTANTLVVVACAGENDIGEGLSLEKSVRALSEFIDVVLEECSNNGKVVLIVLGPKFEPWLEDDPSYKKKYAAMARAFERCLKEHEANGSNSSIAIQFVDCLTMFCGETANLPGARLGGRARAQQQYFASDKLHLSQQGYAVWKEVVEDILQQSLVES